MPINTKQVNQVAVFDNNFTQIFPHARAVRATIREESRPMEHPLETGAIVTDHRIILPVEIELTCILDPEDYTDTYSTIKQYYRNATLLKVQAKSTVYTDQFIVGMPHEEVSEMFDTIAVTILLKQVQFALAKFSSSPRNPNNTNTIDRGVQQPMTPSQATQEQATGSFQ